MSNFLSTTVTDTCSGDSYGRVVKGVGSGFGQTSLQTMALPLTSSLVPGRFLHLFGPQLTHLQNGYVIANPKC